MSQIVEYMEAKRKADSLISVLQHLLDSEMIEDERAQGISRQIIGEKSLQHLSSKQIYRYEKDVLHLIEVDCDGHCDRKIDIEDIENAYLREMELGGIYCQHCMHDIESQSY